MRSSLFRDRVDAGTQLAEILVDHAGRDDVTVLGLPRGGVPVAGVVAQRLGAPLDALVVRKVGMPGHEELALGAVGPDVTLLDQRLIGRVGLSAGELEPTIRREQAERARREAAYRQGREPLDLRGRTVILVDDGLATGATMAVAVEVARSLLASSVLVAVPVASPSGARRLAAVADGVIAVAKPSNFAAVGESYDDFSPVSDAEVCRWLAG